MIYDDIMYSIYTSISQTILSLDTKNIYFWESTGSKKQDKNTQTHFDMKEAKKKQKKYKIPGQKKTRITTVHQFPV